MANEEQVIVGNIEPYLHGRRVIYATSDKVDKNTIVEEVNSALAIHRVNIAEEERLYWYRRGLTPVLQRKKERNAYVLNKITENHAGAIVDFKNGYFLTQPAFYKSRTDGVQSKVEKLNEFLYRSGKQQVDNELADWFHTVGKAALFVRSIDDEKTPFEVYSLDPRTAFVVYSLKPGNKPIMGINVVSRKEQILVDVYTEQEIYHLAGTFVGTRVVNDPVPDCSVFEVKKIEPNPLGLIPIVEYSYNSVNMGAFESVIPLLDAINTIESNRVDGVEQAIQSLIVATNADLRNKDGTEASAEDVRKSGLLLLTSKDGNKSEINILSENLNQTDTQTLVDNIYERMLSICAMPSTTKGGSSTSDTGAAVLARDGWYQADACARNTEDLFKKSNRLFDKIILKILNEKGLLKIDVNDFELEFVRNETANVQSKAQAFQTLLAAGMHPEIAAGKSGISNDPVSDVKRSEKYLTMIWGDPERVNEVQAATTGVGEATIVENPRNTSGNVGGSV